ncbi:MAG: dipeptide epimerase [Flavobacterium sp.]|nr:MAG: dipeptide epimerase [Flavobacterium sp.]
MALSLEFKIYELPLRHPFTISRYTVNIQKTLIATISDGEFSGYGEATVNPYYNSTVERLSAAAERAKPIIAGMSVIHPAEFWQKLEPHLRDNYFALCAIDNAYWDFFARKNGQPLRRYFSDSENAPLTSYTIGMDSLSQMKNKINEMPWPVYKIKLARENVIETVEALRSVTDSVFRIDANCAWSALETIQYAERLKALNVEFIEQPLPAEDVAGMKTVIQNSVLPIIADESCQRFDDVEKCGGLFNGINIKLMKCGGITPALKMIEKARSTGLSVMAGCMTESTVGISALAQIAPLLDYLDSDGALLLASDIASGVSFDYGRPEYASSNGTGAVILV